MLLVTPWLLDGGIERTIQVKAPWLADRGHHVEVVAWQMAETLSGSPNPTLRALASAGVPVRRLSLERRGELLRHAARVARLIRRGRFTVVVGHELFANIVVLLAKLLVAGRVRAIVQVHNEPATYRATGARPALLALARVLFRRADGTVAVSEDLRRAHVAVFGADPARVVTIHNPFEIRQIEAAAGKPVDRRDPAPFVVACGRLTAVKAFPDLIRAFAAVRRHRPLRLVILGEGPDREALVRCAAEAGVAGDVELPGFVSNPFAWFARARCFVLCSHSEGLANVIVEAMAAGVPVVSSRCGGAGEVVEHGRTGLLYEPGDVAGLAAALGAVLDDPAAAARLARAGRERVDEFSQERILPRLERYYLGLGTLVPVCNPAPVFGT